MGLTASPIPVAAITCRPLIYNCRLVADVDRYTICRPQACATRPHCSRHSAKQHLARASTMGKRAERKASGPSQAGGARSWLLGGPFASGAEVLEVVRLLELTRRSKISADSAAPPRTQSVPLPALTYCETSRNRHRESLCGSAIRRSIEHVNSQPRALDQPSPQCASLVSPGSGGGR